MLNGKLMNSTIVLATTKVMVCEGSLEKEE
jgi:hypothetical protein